MNTQKIIIYVTMYVLPVLLLILFLVGMVSGNDWGTVQLSFEWLTKFVLPWIFLYWFIKLVNKIK